MCAECEGLDGLVMDWNDKRCSVKNDMLPWWKLDTELSDNRDDSCNNEFMKSKETRVVYRCIVGGEA